jgi:hypothetical protein
VNIDTGQVLHGEDIEKARKAGSRIVELPCKPNTDCSVCRGKGAVRSYGDMPYAPCPRCYPNHAIRFVSFEQHLRGIQSKPIASPASPSPASSTIPHIATNSEDCQPPTPSCPAASIEP